MLKKIISAQRRLIERLTQEISEANRRYIRTFRDRFPDMKTLDDSYSLPLGPLSNIHSISIVSDNRPLFHQAFEGIDLKTNPFLDPDYQHPLNQIQHDLVTLFHKGQVRCCQSITKSFVGYTFIKAVESYNSKNPDTPIQLDASISQLFGPDPQTGIDYEVTFQDALNMTTGIRWKQGVPELKNVEFTDPRHPLRDMLSRKNPFAFVLDKLKSSTETGRFEYSAAMSVFLAHCIEVLSSRENGKKTPYHETVNQTIGEDLSWYTWPKSGLAAPSSGAHLSHESLFNFTKRLASDTAFLQHLLRSRVPAEGKPKGFYYSNQFWVVELERQTADKKDIQCFEIAMFGNGGQRAPIIVEERGSELIRHGIYLVQAGDYSAKSLSRFFPDAPLLNHYVLPYLGLYPKPSAEKS